MTIPGLLVARKPNRATLHDIGISYEEWRALCSESKRLILSGCIGKVLWTRTGAQESAARLRTQDGEEVSIYPCPYVLQGRGNPHWHVGHVPPQTTIEAIARTVRDLHGTRPPTWVDGERPADLPSKKPRRRKKEKTRR